MMWRVPLPPLPWYDPRRHPWIWVAALAAVYFAITFAASTILYLNLRETSYDLGIFEQALTSQNVHFAIPFYEMPDCSNLGLDRCSFLLVHPAFLLYAVAPVYAAAPTPFLLFGLESAAAALAALPLFALTRDVTGSVTRGLLAAGLYFVWVPIFASTAFSFHLEALLPVEFLSAFYFWRSGRYALGGLFVGLSFVTIETAPAFMFLMALFFLLPSLERGWRDFRSIDRSRGKVLPKIFGRAVAWIGEELRRIEVRMALLLAVGSVLAYVLLLFFVNDAGFSLLGLGGPTVGSSGVLSNPSAPGLDLNFAGYNAGFFRANLLYWLLLYGLLGFIPLLAPRTLVLSVPWIGYTFLTNQDHLTNLGHQYVGLIAGPILVGLAYGMVRVPLGRTSPHPRAAVVRIPPPAPAERQRTYQIVRRRRPWTLAALVWLVVLLAAVIANLSLGPLNPNLPAAAKSLDLPYTVAAYSLAITPGFHSLASMLALAPSGSVLMLPHRLYPMVANDVEAVAYPVGSGLHNLPFNASLPQFIVLGVEAALGTPPPYLLLMIQHHHGYGLLAFDPTTGVGPIYLYELSYMGNPVTY